jgi:hypothetical protein
MTSIGNDSIGHKPIIIRAAGRALKRGAGNVGVETAEQL